MGTSTTGIRLLAADEWQTFRRLRLRSLADAPECFGATLAEARARPEQVWREILSKRVQYVAEADGVELGTVGAMRDVERTGVHLISMWVAPEARGTGVADLLVETVLDWADTAGSPAVWLAVADGNTAAERLYLRHGFVRTGVTGPVGPDDPRIEHEWVRRR
ncbi:GNAT family N-acetyltransferase [Nocardia brasiliensis]|uniref:GNAT family N-acetyltransferase n=1 Tax=Nocardia brasiliensis TaxID=37326 RepID=A0A6G9XP87_NOCBR|nr:GNAT family N-acetyltransferase [Nocardia brasiliensis]QIS02735.1 GNAT family N-acetyltransferase [Nocardia brasiliensis]